MARHLRLSQERVRQLEITAIQKLRMIARQRRLAEFLPDTGLQSL
jgi:DNA-directed RNA polymerase sigma subunit (sigma70/sigma32)